MCKNDLLRLVSMTKEEYMQENPSYEPMFPKGWDDDSRWPDFDKESNADFWARWEPHQMRIDYELETMHGC
jgi:alpha-glucosidase (family GH31 glycosyl hydrolase)